MLPVYDTIHVNLSIEDGDSLSVKDYHNSFLVRGGAPGPKWIHKEKSQNGFAVKGFSLKASKERDVSDDTSLDNPTTKNILSLMGITNAALAMFI